MLDSIIIETIVKALYQRVRAVESVSDPTLVGIALPQWGLDVLKQFLTTTSMNSGACTGNLSNYLPKTFSNLCRRPGSGFFDIYSPGFVKTVGKVDLNACELCGLSLGNQTEPVAPGH